MPAPTPSPAATIRGIGKRRWSSSNAPRSFFARSIFPPARPAAVRLCARPKPAPTCSSSTRWAASSWTRSTTPSPRSTASLPLARLRQGADAIVVDIHAEATSEKQSMGQFCDGRASLVVGTHTHAPTADLRVLPGGTAFMSDVGMTGDYNSVIGMAKDEPLQRFTRRIAYGALRGGLGPGDALCRRGRDRPGDGACGARRRGAARRRPRTGGACLLGVSSDSAGHLYCHSGVIPYTMSASMTAFASLFAGRRSSAQDEEDE